MGIVTRAIVPLWLVVLGGCDPSLESPLCDLPLSEIRCPSSDCFRGEYAGIVEGLDAREDGTSLNERYLFTVRFDERGKVTAVTDVCDNGELYEFTAEGQQFRTDVAGNAASAYQASTRILTIVGVEYIENTVTITLAFQRWERDAYFTAAAGTSSDFRVLSSRSDATVRLDCMGGNLHCEVARTSDSATPNYRSHSGLSGILVSGPAPEPDFSGKLLGILQGNLISVDSDGQETVRDFRRQIDLTFNAGGRLVSCTAPVEQIQLDRNYRCNTLWHRFIQPIQRIRTTYIVRDIEYGPNLVRFIIERESRSDDGYCYVSEGVARTAIELTRNETGPHCSATYASDSSWQELCDAPRVRTHGEWIGVGQITPSD